MYATEELFQWVSKLNWNDKAMEFTEKNSVSIPHTLPNQLKSNWVQMGKIMMKYIQVVLISVCVIVGKKVAVSIIMLLI